MLPPQRGSRRRAPRLAARGKELRQFTRHRCTDRRSEAKNIFGAVRFRSVEWRKMQGLSLELPTGYYLERDPDVLILRRLDGSMVGAFSARGAVPEAVRKAVEESDSVGSHEGREASAPTRRAAMQARFFGHFELLCDGEPVHLGRNGKALAILKHLLANRSRPVSQDHLMGWLWPDSNLKKARWSLNSAIHGLRKLLGSCPSSEAVT